MSHLVPCPGCQRHIRVVETACPFCSQELALQNVPPRPLPRSRLGRAKTFWFGATLAGATAIASCGGDAEEDSGSGGSTGSGGTSATTGGSSTTGGGYATGGSYASGGSSAATGGSTGEAGATGEAGSGPLDDGGVQPPYGFPADDGGAMPVYGGPPAD